MVSSLRSAEEVQILLRYGRNLVLRKRDAVILQYVKPRTLSTATSNTTSATVATFNSPILPQPQLSLRNRSHSMDRLADTNRTRKVSKFSQNYEILWNDWQILKVKNYTKWTNLVINIDNWVSGLLGMFSDLSHFIFMAFLGAAKRINTFITHSKCSSS